MGHTGRVLDETLGGTQGDSQVNAFHSLADLCSFRIARELKRNHATEAVSQHLLCKLMVRMRLQARIVHSSNVWMCLQKFRNLLGVRTVRSHARHERLHATAKKVGFPRTQRITEELLKVPKPLQQPLVTSRHTASHHVGVASQVLGAGMDGNVDPRIAESLLMKRCPKGAIHSHCQALWGRSGQVDLQAQGSQCFEVCQAHGGVCRRLRVQQSGVRSNSGTPLLDG
mmetsp:Transcript_38085/g.61394  ORF Transcript_38085/g.61394 Transcript_38085/m.61394 type:complete len:227 (-) Transcript_38085:621-1301(-)